MTRRFGARRMLRRLVLKLRFSYGFRGLFGSYPLRCKTLGLAGFFAFQASFFGFPAHPCLQVLRRLVRCRGTW
jgi:hypothetical protein